MSLETKDNFLWNEFFLPEIDNSWEEFFQQEKQKKYFFQLLNILNKNYKLFCCFPEKKDIFRIFKEISLEKIKVIILGQDPYHISGVADGIAFSSKKSKYIPRSLKNIFLELKKDLNCEKPEIGDLLCWVKEGVFLLNTTLTVQEKKPLSDFNLWREFTLSLLNYLKEKKPETVWIFWGKKAIELQQECEISPKQSITSAHPSPYSASQGFFFSKPFSKTNQLLLKMKIPPVNWTVILNKSTEKKQKQMLIFS